MEVWKDIKEYEGFYQISSYGRVRNSKDEIIAQRSDKNGYKVINLSKKGTKKTYRVHRLVAETFIENPNNFPEINHKDETRDNNHVENLEWCDRKYNNNYGHKIEKSAAYMKANGPKGKDNYFSSHIFVGANHARSKSVIQMDHAGNIIATYDCARSAAESVNCSPSAITAVCRGEREQAKGYIWQYK